MYNKIHMWRTKQIDGKRLNIRFKKFAKECSFSFCPTSNLKTDLSLDFLPLFLLRRLCAECFSAPCPPFEDLSADTPSATSYLAGESSTGEIVRAWDRIHPFFFEFCCWPKWTNIKIIKLKKVQTWLFFLVVIRGYAWIHGLTCLHSYISYFLMKICGFQVWGNLLQTFEKEKFWGVGWNILIDFPHNSWAGKPLMFSLDTDPYPLNSIGILKNQVPWYGNLRKQQGKHTTMKQQTWVALCRYHNVDFFPQNCITLLEKTTDCFKWDASIRTKKYVLICLSRFV